MRPKICVPIVEMFRNTIISRAREYVVLPIDMVEWRVDFYSGYEEELLSIVSELKHILGKKELIVTIRTEAEGGEPNGSRFDYFAFVQSVLEQNQADYVDIEVARNPALTKEICEKYKEGTTKVIGSYHDFSQTPSKKEIMEKLQMAKEVGCRIGKLACMPQSREDVDVLLEATAAVKEAYPEFSLITMSMGELGVNSRLYGGLYGSEVSFGCVGQTSAPGQISYSEMGEVFDKIYCGNRHVILIGYMGVGKTTIAKELSQQTNRNMVDMDQWIEEQEGRTINEIFEKEGELYFRDLETKMIDELGKMKPSIISCGGGMPLREINARKLQALGTVVLLTAEPESIYSRVTCSDNRPLLKDNMNVSYITEMLKKRMPYYERAANVKVATDQGLISDIAKEILEKCF